MLRAEMQYTYIIIYIYLVESLLLGPTPATYFNVRVFLGARSWHSCGQALLFNTFEESGGSLGGVQYTPVTPSLHFHF